jgi:hypothetical protein
MKTETMVAKPTAVATIDPLGRRTQAPRDHSITLTIKLSTIDSMHADQHTVARVVRQSLAVFAPPDGQPGQQKISEMVLSRPDAKHGSDSRVVVGVEGAAISNGRPARAAVDALRAVLMDAGYRVTIKERRECAEPECLVDVMVDWDRSTSVPTGWFSEAICGRHGYRACPTCGSLYTLTSENSSVAAPSVHCVVCGAVMIEWGGSKTWSAELVTRGQAGS